MPGWMIGDCGPRHVKLSQSYCSSQPSAPSADAARGRRDLAHVRGPRKSARCTRPFLRRPSGASDGRGVLRVTSDRVGVAVWQPAAAPPAIANTRVSAWCARPARSRAAARTHDEGRWRVCRFLELALTASCLLPARRRQERRVGAFDTFLTEFSTRILRV